MSKLHFWLSNILFYTSHSIALVALFVIGTEIYFFQSFTEIGDQSIFRIILHSTILVLYVCTNNVIGSYCKKHGHTYTHNKANYVKKNENTCF